MKLKCSQNWMEIIFPGVSARERTDRKEELSVVCSWSRQQWSDWMLCGLKLLYTLYHSDPPRLPVFNLLSFKWWRNKWQQSFLLQSQSSSTKQACTEKKPFLSYSFCLETQPFRRALALTAKSQTTPSLSHPFHTSPPFSRKSIFLKWNYITLPFSFHRERS